MKFKKTVLLLLNASFVEKGSFLAQFSLIKSLFKISF